MAEFFDPETAQRLVQLFGLPFCNIYFVSGTEIFLKDFSCAKDKVPLEQNLDDEALVLLEEFIIKVKCAGYVDPDLKQRLLKLNVPLELIETAMEIACPQINIWTSKKH